MSSTPARLSCKECQLRKKRCNKDVPCSACSAGGLSCTPVERSRLPRGRSGNQASTKSIALAKRVAHLEAIVETLKSIELPASCNDAATAEVQPAPAGISRIRPQVLAPEFWSSLQDAVDGLRDVLEDDEDDVEGLADANNDASPTTNGALSSADDLLRNEVNPGSDSTYLMFRHDFDGNACSSTLHQDLQYETRLIEVYRERFDPIFKVLHWPTAHKLISFNNSNTNYCASLDGQVLRAAMLFASVCTLSDDEDVKKGLLLEKYRKQVETCLIQSRLLTTTNIQVLQAFVIYLAALRTCQTDAQQWTLVAVAVRLATAQRIQPGLQKEPRNLHSELRRKLWYCIGMLDMQSAFDRGSRPLLQAEHFQSPPLDIDDAELSSKAILESIFEETRPGFTEMTFCVTSHRAMVCQHKLISVNAQFSNAKTNMSDSCNTWWEAQVRIVTEFEEYLRNLTEDISNPITPLRRFTVAVATEATLAMRLLLYRPLYKLPDGLKPVEDGFDVLESGTKLLESAAFKLTPDFDKWSWYSWPKWYALAIVLAELSIHPQHPLANGAWTMAEVSFESYKMRIAETETGLLWKPIAKLMHKARSSRQMLRHPLIPPTNTDQSASALEASSSSAYLGSQLESCLPRSTCRPALDLDSDESMFNLDGVQAGENDLSLILPPTNDLHWTLDDISILNWNSFLDDLRNEEVH